MKEAPPTKHRALWSRTWLMIRDTQQLSHYSQLMRELEVEDPASYKKLIRHKPHFFQELTSKYLAMGNSYEDTLFSFCVVTNTMSGVVKQVCAAIVEEYREKVIPTPTTPEGWKAKANLFEMAVSPCSLCNRR